MLYPLGHDLEYTQLLREEHEAMKNANTQSTRPVANNNLATLTEWVKKQGKDCPYLDLLGVIADCLDHIANGHDMYLVIGSTRSVDSFSLNWKGDGAPGAVYGTDLVGLSMNAADLL